MDINSCIKKNDDNRNCGPEGTVNITSVAMDSVQSPPPTTRASLGRKRCEIALMSFWERRWKGTQRGSSASDSWTAFIVERNQNNAGHPTNAVPPPRCDDDKVQNARLATIETTELFPRLQWPSAPCATCDAPLCNDIYWWVYFSADYFSQCSPAIPTTTMRFESASNQWTIIFVHIISRVHEQATRRSNLLLL